MTGQVVVTVARPAQGSSHGPARLPLVYLLMACVLPAVQACLLIKYNLKCCSVVECESFRGRCIGSALARKATLVRGTLLGGVEHGTELGAVLSCKVSSQSAL